MSTRIIAKRWDNDEDQIITDLKFETQKEYTILAVWNFIHDKVGECHTFENEVTAKVYARTNDKGTKYLTSHNDGVTENNLDELPDC